MNAKKVIKEVNADFQKWFGRSYGNGLVEEYKCDNVDAVLVSMGVITSYSIHYTKLYESTTNVG